MRKYTWFTLALIGITFLACQSESNKKAPPKDLPTEKVFPLSIQLGGEYGELDVIRAQARSTIDYRIENGGKALSMMTSGYWWPEFVYYRQKITGEGHYDGYWVQYKDDFTYEYGVYDEVWGSGRYHYDLDKMELLLLDDDVEQEPKVYQGNYNGNLMSYIGRHTWGINNGMQIKMVPIDTKPTKQG